MPHDRSGGSPGGTDAGFATALQAAAERVREAAGADIVAVYPYDEETDSFYAPIAMGLTASDLVRALPDLGDQLRRFRADQADGKVPAEFSIAQYGPTAWLLATRRPLVSDDAEHEVDSSFVRRHHVVGMLALPLRVGTRVVGLVYVDYLSRGRRKPVDVRGRLPKVEVASEALANAIDVARQAAESEILRSISTLINNFATLPVEIDDELAANRRLQLALRQVLEAVHLDAAALYAPGSGGRLVLMAQMNAPAIEHRAAVLTVARDELRDEVTVGSALAEEGMAPVAVLEPLGQGHGAILLLADHDSLALHRRVPAAHTLLQAAADLLGAAVASGRLIEAMGDTSRTLSAVTRLSNRLLQPGATKEEALQTAVCSLTDPSLPELDFEFANIFLLDTLLDGTLIVKECAGAASSTVIQTVSGGPTRARVPSWAASGSRVLDGQDVVAYVATHRRTVIVAPLAGDGEAFVTGYPEEELSRKQVPVIKSDGSVAAYVHAVRLREAADRSPLRSDIGESGVYQPTDDFTLNAELFDAHDHASLVRVFVPYGSDPTGARASGVLEAGYHVGRQQRLDRTEIEALRASAATIAVAVENARLYEEATGRARQLEIVNEVSRAIATSIDVEQTLRLIARNMARSVDASICLIALLDEDGSAWYGAAASNLEDIWRQRRVERPEPSIIFKAADEKQPIVVEDALSHDLVSSYVARRLGLSSLVALPLVTGDAAIGAVILGQTERRVFTGEEVDRAQGLADQAAMAIRNARVHAREEEEHHIQKDVVLIGFGQWGQKAYHHLVLLKHFFNFRIHVVERERPGRREALAEAERSVLENGDLFYWDSSETPARDALAIELEPSCYVITYIATPAETHLPVLKLYYGLSNVVLIEKPLGAPPEEYKAFLDTTDGSVQIVAADHYWFKIEVRLLELLLTEERSLRAFLDEIEEVEIEILEAQPPSGSGAQIGMIADLIPHAFAVLSLLTPLDRVELAPHQPLQVGRYEPITSEHETYARLEGVFEHRGRPVRLIIDVGKGVADAKWIKLIGPRRMGGRRSFYKFDFVKGEVIDGTQSALRAATRPIRQPGVPDNAHLTMLRHVVEKRYPATGILSIHEAIRANARIRALVQMANDLLEAGQWTPYEQGQRPAFVREDVLELRPPVDWQAEIVGS